MEAWVILLFCIGGAHGFTLDIQRPPIRTITNRPYALDIGCGDGKSTVAFQKKFPDAVVIGVDINKKCIEAALDNDRGFFVHGDAGEELFPATFFEIVHMRYSMLDIMNKIQVIDQMHRVMKKDSIIFMADYVDSHPVMKNHPLSGFHDYRENLEMMRYYFRQDAIFEKDHVLYSMFVKE